MKEITEPDGHIRAIPTTAEELGRCIVAHDKARKCKLWHPPAIRAKLKKEKLEGKIIEKELIKSGLTRGINLSE